MNERLGLVALVLAAGLAIALVAVTIALVVDAATAAGPSRLSENETQVLIGWGGGIVGVLGAYVGYRVASGRRHHDDDDA